jgi:hypothetical protein
MNKKLYLHEYIDIILQNRASYFDHMLGAFTDGIRARQQSVVGVWGTLGSTGRWPEVINLWEYDGGFASVAHHFKHETRDPSMQDAELKVWWAKAAQYRSGGFDRLLIPAPYSPTVDESLASKKIVGSKVYYHERISIQPGQAKSYLALMADEWLPQASAMGMNLVGAYRTAMRNDSEVIVIWAIREWETWAEIEDAYEESDKVAKWRRRTQGMALDWINHLMCPAGKSPFMTGKRIP